MGQENIHIITEQSAAGISGGDSPAPPAQNNTYYILAVTRNGRIAEPVMEYALNVAERLKYSILAVYINPLPFFRDGGRRSELFASAMQESSERFKEKGAARSIPVEHIGIAGKIGKVINQLCHSEKRVEFVVIDQGISMKEVSSQSPVPVFSVIYTHAKAGRLYKTTHNRTLINKGETGMSTTKSRKRYLKNCFVFGALTAGLYAAVFTNQEFVMTNFTKGGLFAILPVAMVFAISYVHGSFSSSFWSALGIEGSKATATKKADIRRDTPVSTDTRKDTRPRAQANV